MAILIVVVVTAVARHGNETAYSCRMTRGSDTEAQPGNDPPARGPNDPSAQEAAPGQGQAGGGQVPGAVYNYTTYKMTGGKIEGPPRFKEAHSYTNWRKQLNIWIRTTESTPWAFSHGGSPCAKPAPSPGWFFPESCSSRCGVGHLRIFRISSTLKSLKTTSLILNVPCDRPRLLPHREPCEPSPGCHSRCRSFSSSCHQPPPHQPGHTHSSH